MSKTSVSECRCIDSTELVRHIVRYGKGEANWRASSAYPSNYRAAEIWFFPKPLPPGAPEDGLFVMRLVTKAKVGFGEHPSLWTQEILVVSAPIRGKLKPDNRAGGVRQWWICPACARRAKKLYLYPRSAAWKCRLCHGLCHDSQREMPAKLKRELELAGVVTAGGLR